jgi:hypothetical protein
MSVITRKFSACPVRTAANAWNAIVAVIASASAGARSELLKIEGIAASIISDETPGENPIVVIGSGPRLRVYCLYEEDGSTEDANEAALNWNPFEGDWEIHLPAEKEELSWVRKALAEKGTRFKVYEAGTKPATEDEDNTSGQQSKQLTIDTSKL